jgi:large conductance mechanosensitive channel
MFKDFKEFIMRGNVLDLAVAVVIGGAFGKIVTSMVNDMIMPPIGVVLGKVDFSNLYINLSGTEYKSLSAAQAAGAATINYGLFVNTVINFIIVAAAIFIVVRMSNKIKIPAKSATPTTKACPYCLSTIPIKATRCSHCTSEVS